MLVKRPLDERLRWFPEARFGLFIHFGLYALLGRGEWVMYHERIPRETYAALARRFNPRRFDADEWADTARRAGARYLVFTAKHHDGFCLFDSALTDFKITHTPFGRDLVGELVRACRRRRLRIVLYYSQPDWHHRNFVHRPGAFKDLQTPRPDDRPDWAAYRRYVFGQVEELCTRYGRIDGIWFDGVHKTEREWRGRDLYRLIKRHQPAAVVNERAGWGDFFTPERRLAAAPAAAGYMVESCQSICRESWGWRRDGTLFSSPRLIESLARMAAADGNYLLNIGPRADGSLPEDQVRRLLDVGDWLRAHGRAIYATGGLPGLEPADDCLMTRRGRAAYLHLLRWPESDAPQVRGLSEAPVSARLLVPPKRLTVRRKGDLVEIAGLPSAPEHPFVNVIELLFASERFVRTPRRAGAPAPVAVRAEGVTRLTGREACISGFGPKGSRIARDARGALTRWSSPEQRATWRLRCPRDLVREVLVEIGCESPYEGSTFALNAAGQTLIGRVPATGRGRFRRVRLGRLRLPEGVHSLTLAPKRLNYGYVFADVRCVRLEPVRDAAPIRASRTEASRARHH